jgi:hypothetical protein
MGVLLSSVLIEDDGFAALEIPTGGRGGCALSAETAAFMGVCGNRAGFLLQADMSDGEIVRIEGLESIAPGGENHGQVGRKISAIGEEPVDVVVLLGEAEELDFSNTSASLLDL